MNQILIYLLTLRRHPKPGVLFLEQLFQNNNNGLQLIGVAATINSMLRQDLRKKNIVSKIIVHLI